jgi:hypothetical protein
MWFANLSRSRIRRGNHGTVSERSNASFSSGLIFLSSFHKGVREWRTRIWHDCYFTMVELNINKVCYREMPYSTVNLQITMTKYNSSCSSGCLLWSFTLCVKKYSRAKTCSTQNYFWLILGLFNSFFSNIRVHGMVIYDISTYFTSERCIDL